MNVTVCSCPFCVHMEEVLMIDEWNGLADMLANLIEKYASDLDIDNLPDVTVYNHAKDERDKAEELKDASC